MGGAVTPVKNQGQCGSCWSFSTTGSTEGAWQIAGHDLVSLSEQQLMDCSTAEGDHSCQGGLMDFGFKYIVDNKGIDSEADYPYKMANEACQTAKETSVVATITGYSDVPKQNVAQFKAALAKGPVSIAIEADQTGFQHYQGGILDATCGTKLDHGVLAVGYTDDYWIVKNSWGTVWGEQGYVRMSSSVGAPDGECGLLDQPSYPTAGSGPAPGPTPPGPNPGPPSPATCSSVDPGNRTDCGFGLQKAQCEAKGCCYDTTQPGTFTCFNAPGNRTDCGYKLEKDACIAKGCCYDETVPNTYRCFNKGSGPTPPGPGPNPPPPSGGHHYEDPNAGPCMAGEKLSPLPVLMVSFALLAA